LDLGDDLDPGEKEEAGSAGCPHEASSPAIEAKEEVAVTSEPIDRSSIMAVADWTDDLDDLDLGDDMDLGEKEEVGSADGPHTASKPVIEAKEVTTTTIRASQPIDGSSGVAVVDRTEDSEDLDLGNDLDPGEKEEGGFGPHVTSVPTIEAKEVAVTSKPIDRSSIMVVADWTEDLDDLDLGNDLDSGDDLEGEGNR